ncbi:hypothetical protein K402DRAFT_70192 [Aulographum hederae CBS 113979]|uniref:Uncharacterized protein n=1 Tax=Aulographum hederae CBS 113979 TaxID=1176131 RepID=A0A6G1HF85_9PEZI|nr:hypothetical protein K402DRAFT_70192 [Aulographum hederae CBS 113979]
MTVLPGSKTSSLSMSSAIFPWGHHQISVPLGPVRRPISKLHFQAPSRECHTAVLSVSAPIPSRLDFSCPVSCRPVSPIYTRAEGTTSIAAVAFSFCSTMRANERTAGAWEWSRLELLPLQPICNLKREMPFPYTNPTHRQPVSSTPTALLAVPPALLPSNVRSKSWVRSCRARDKHSVQSLVRGSTLPLSVRGSKPSFRLWPPACPSSPTWQGALTQTKPLC